MILRRLLLVVLALLGFGPAGHAAPQAMVAAANPMAVEAGLEVLRRGGSAVDAAIAVQMVLGVVEPQASGIGGGGFLLHYDAATSAIAVYDGRETAPAGASPTMFLGADGKPIGMLGAVVSGISVGVPGARRHAGAGAQGARQAGVARAVPAGDRHGARRLRGAAAAGWLAAAHADRRSRHPRGLLQRRRLDQEAGRADRQPGAGRDHAPDRRAGRARLLRRRYRARDRGAGAQACAAGHAVAGRSRQLQADQARAGVRSLSRVDRLRHAAAVIRRHRRPAGAGPARTLRAVARQARRPARPASHRRGKPARLRRPQPLRRRSGVRRRCPWPACCRRPISPSAAS